MIPQLFDKVVCMNLECRSDRWDIFQAGIPNDWPFKQPIRIQAIDGKKTKPPSWWSGKSNGSWGCYRTHLQIIEQAVNEDIHSILILEDDALFCKNFSQKVIEFMKELPIDWGMIFLGGQHLHMRQHPPTQFTEHVYVPYNINRTHAYALQGPMLKKIYQYLLKRDWTSGHHIDHHYGRLHQQRSDLIYCPDKWLVGQRGGFSNISGKTPVNKFWTSASRFKNYDPNKQIFLLILGIHSSGTSAMAGCLWFLNIHLGARLNGYYGKPPINGGEGEYLIKIVETAITFGNTTFNNTEEVRHSQLKQWINTRRIEAATGKTIAGGKHPLLCQFGNQLLDICGDKLRVIHLIRPFEESVISVKKRELKINSAQIIAHLNWLQKGKESILARVPAKHQIDVTYTDLIEKTRAVILDIIKFGNIPIPSETQLCAAVKYVDPSQRHIHLAITKE